MARPRRPYVAIRQREGRSGIGLEVPLLYLSILVGRGGTMPLKRGMDTGSRGRMRWSSGKNTGLRCKRGVDNYFVYTMIFNIGPLNHLVDLVDINISDQSKEAQAITHRNMVNQWVNEKSEIDDKIIVYSDGSQ